METEFYREVHVGTKYRMHRRFLLWFTPLFFVGFGVVMWKFRDKFEGFPMVEAIACGVGAAGLTWLVVETLSRNPGCQVWAVEKGRVRYESPSRLLGKSFDVPLGEIVEVGVDPQSEGGRIEMRDGSSVMFLTEERESEAFFEFLKGYVEKYGVE